MAEGDVEWELSKENIQPLRRGRDISALHQALSLQQEASNSTVCQHRQAFEAELRVNDGEDPLDVWDRYIKWTVQTFPQGGKESNISVLLERAITRFAEEKKYYNDSRYLDIWLKFAEHCPDPLDIFRYMQSKGIGVLLSAFYIAWSEEYERMGNYKKADCMYQEGFKCGAEPREKLMQFHRSLQARVSRHVMSAIADQDSSEEDDAMEIEEPQRITLGELKTRGKKKAVAPINRTGNRVISKIGLQMNAPLGPVQNSCLMVFDENKASFVPQEPKPESWMALPSSRAKENEQRPDKWTNIKVQFGQVIRAPPSRPNFQPFVEECDLPPTMTPCKINPSVNLVLSARKLCREETPLKRLQSHQQQQRDEGRAPEQSMYCKELLFSGATEFCFEELRAERFRQKLLTGTCPCHEGAHQPEACPSRKGAHPPEASTC
uniref:BUB1 N-terminal domain-containing protein n=1 Tax=Denticeps clupeoides TaxID=299321 RepID=A0AAY4CYN1_9TELE